MSRNATFTFSILFECHVLDSTSYITLKKTKQGRRFSFPANSCCNLDLLSKRASQILSTSIETSTLI